MDLNYIILAHKNPAQVKRLVTNLDAPWVNFYIHIDQNIDLQPFQNEIPFDNVFFLNDKERKEGTWGDIKIVEGTINVLKKIIRDNRTGYCILLSGQDFPLRNPNSIRDYFIKNEGVHFIDYYQDPKDWLEKSKERLSQYKINRSTNRGDFFLLPSLWDKKFYNHQNLSNLSYLLRNKRLTTLSLLFKKRNFPKNVHPYCGSVYWALPINTVKDLLKFIQSNPAYKSYHFYTTCADEIFFHSILLSLFDPEKYPTKHSLTYVNWKKKSGVLPVTFSHQDIKELSNASKTFLFARKFDVNHDEKILNEIEETLLCH